MAWLTREILRRGALPQLLDSDLYFDFRAPGHFYIAHLSPPRLSSTMGKRKKAAKKPQGKKRNEPLATTFPCLFCNHEKSVTVKLDKKAGVGQLSCKVCNQQFQCAVNYLSAAVDVYSDWVDACDAVAKEAGDDGGAGGDFAPRAQAPGRPSVGRARDEVDEADDDDDDAIIDDEDGLGGYGGRAEGIVPDDEDDY